MSPFFRKKDINKYTLTARAQRSIIDYIRVNRKILITSQLIKLLHRLPINVQLCREKMNIAKTRTRKAHDSWEQHIPNI